MPITVTEFTLRRDYDAARGKLDGHGARVARDDELGAAALPPLAYLGPREAPAVRMRGRDDREARADGRDKFIRLMRADKAKYVKSYQSYGASAPPIYDPTIRDLTKLLNANNYQKGGWTLHMLRRVMGDEKFFAGIRDYYRTYRDRNALTDDLRKVMEVHHGRPLDWFFKQWVFEPGYPVYDATWNWDEAAKALKLRVAQKQSPTVFRMPLDVEFKIGGATRREVIQVNERVQTFDFKLDAKPQGVALDPDEWVLKVLTINEGR